MFTLIPTWKVKKMIKCHKCNVYINTSVSKCPLCHNPLEKNEGIDVFPIPNFDYKKHNLFIKLLNSLVITTFIIYLIN